MSIDHQILKLKPSLYPCFMASKQFKVALMFRTRASASLIVANPMFFL